RCSRPAAPPPSQARGQALTLDAKAFPMLTSLGRNLSQAAREGKLDPVVGRAREVEEVIDILGKRRTNNPCLLGEPAWARRRWWRAWRSACWGCAARWRRRSSWSWTWPRWWRARSCAARSRRSSTP
ncbi:hypothetical protein, partial [Corallococcus sp. 4LFB]|uniref:hypothetical protein n=1 Tax=Corallococcus sp. 4LFB TaxID=3383249 RepID=UPI0039767607